MSRHAAGKGGLNLGGDVTVICALAPEYVYRQWEAVNGWRNAGLPVVVGWPTGLESDLRPCFASPGTTVVEQSGASGWFDLERLTTLARHVKTARVLATRPDIIPDPRHCASHWLDDGGDPAGLSLLLTNEVTQTEELLPHPPDVGDAGGRGAVGAVLAPARWLAETDPGGAELTRPLWGEWLACQALLQARSARTVGNNWLWHVDDVALGSRSPVADSHWPASVLPAWRQILAHPQASRLGDVVYLGGVIDKIARRMVAEGPGTYLAEADAGVRACLLYNRVLNHVHRQVVS